MRHRIVPTVILSGLLVMACSAGTSDSSGAPASDQEEPPPDAAGDLAGAGSGSGGGEADLTEVERVTGTAVQADRDIVYTGSIGATTGDVAGAANAVADAARAEGGFVFARRIQGGSPPVATLTLKVPAPRFEAAFERIVEILAGDGDLVEQSITAEDVSDQVVDLESRRRSVSVSVERIRSFLGEADTVEEVARLEAELTRREAELETIEGRLRVLEDRTSLGTLLVDLTGRDGDAFLAASGEDDDDPAFVAGLRRGWDVLAGAGSLVALAAGFVSPFLPVLVVFALAAWWVGRRRPPQDTQPEVAAGA